MGVLAAEVMKLGFLLTLVAFAVWVGSASVAAWVAWEKGREPVAWFVIAFFLTPLVALIALGAVPARHLAREREPRPIVFPERRRRGEGSVPTDAPADEARTEDKRWAVSGASRW